MSIETGVLISKSNEPIYWHLPQGRNSVYLPDSKDLWDIFWENRESISGFAHSHPGSGIPHPSFEDITTFSAIELALGQNLNWWIVSSDKEIIVNYSGPNKYDFKVQEIDLTNLDWALKLRELSHYTKGKI